MTKTAVNNTVEFLRPYRMGDIVQGTIIGIGRSAIYVDLGPQGTGIVYGREFFDEKDALKEAKIGDELTTKITGLENKEG